MKTSSEHQLSVEKLEDRMMLSTVEIFAASLNGTESFDLLVDGHQVSSFQPSSQSDLNNRITERFVYESDKPIDPSQISLRFNNSTGAGGSESALFFDRIIVDGESIETEGSGTFVDFADGRPDGFYQTETIFGDATLSFNQDQSRGPIGTRIRVDAIGETGEEILQLQVNGEVVQEFTFDQAGQRQTFFFCSDDVVDIRDVRVSFANDAITAAGDRNLIVEKFQTIDKITGERTVARPGNNNVISPLKGSTPLANTGIFSSGAFVNGFADGFGRGEQLSTNGFFEVRTVDPPPRTRIRVDAFGDTGQEKFEVIANGVLLDTVMANQDSTPYFFDIPGEVDPNSVIVRFINDGVDGNGADRNLNVTKIQLIGLDGQDIRLPDGRQANRGLFRTTGPNVSTTGAFVDGSIQSGVGLSEKLVVDGFFRLVDSASV